MRSFQIGSLEPEVPIISGGMAVEISMAPLVAAVANEGGIGLLPASGLKPKRLVEEIRFTREFTDGIIGVNVMMAVRECKELSFAAIDKDVDLLVVGAGFIPKLLKEIIAKAHKNSTFVAYIASSPKAAKLAERFNVDAIIAEGYHAGGHLGTKKSIWEILPKMVSSVTIPVIAAGGCGTRADFQKAIDLGASGIQMGTRFALSREAGKCVSKTWQQTLLEADKEDIVILDDEVGSPVKMPFRVVKTPAIERLIQKGVSHVQGQRPKCGQKCLRHCEYRDSGFNKSFCIFEGLRLAKKGDKENGVFTLGEQAKKITDLPTVKEIIDELTRRV